MEAPSPCWQCIQKVRAGLTQRCMVKPGRKKCVTCQGDCSFYVTGSNAQLLSRLNQAYGSVKQAAIWITAGSADASARDEARRLLEDGLVDLVEVGRLWGGLSWHGQRL